MELTKFFVLSFCLVLAFSLGAAYPGTGGTGSGGDFSGEVTGCPYPPDDDRCTDPDDPSSYDDNELPKCNDGENDNGLWGEDYAQEMWDGDEDYVKHTDSDGDLEGDPGCSSPWDDTEAVLWDTDLTATFNGIDGIYGGVSGDPTVFFNGSVRVGPDLSGWSGDTDSFDLKYGDDLSAKPMVERTLKATNPSLGSGKYGVTGLGQDPAGNSKGEFAEVDLPPGTVMTDSDRIVDPPVSSADVSGVSSVKGGDYVTCGDGSYSTGENFAGVDDIDPGFDGDVNLQTSQDEGCKADFGIVRKMYDNSLIYDSGSFSSTDETCDSSGSSTPGAGKDNAWYEADGDMIVAHWWDKGSDETDCADPGDEDEDIENLDTYTHERDEDFFNCDSLNRVNGGTDSSGFDSIDNEKPDNDPAGTATDFKAYGDPDEHNMVWCQYEEMLTVDADGPAGKGDGFVVIDDGSGVIGTIGPGGGDTVGQSVHSRTASHNSEGSLTQTPPDTFHSSFLQFTRDRGMWDWECPETGSNNNRANYCIKYLDFMTKGQGNDWNNVEDAVKVEVHQFPSGNDAITPDQSYSACKFINMVSKDQGSGEVLDCDYEASIGDASGDMSPLNQPCGDQDDEHLVMAEGDQINFRFFTKEIYQSQDCINFGQEEGVGVAKPDGDARTLTDDACTLGGRSYAIGTVRNVTDYGVNAEAGEYSPDLEVCLNPDIDATDNVKWDNDNNAGTGSQGNDQGGEWYDMDNERVQTYIRDNFDADAYTEDSTPDQEPINRIETYMRKNPNPHDDRYNPTGGETGLVMEDDCGNDRFDSGLDCEDDSIDPAPENFFYTFFEEVIP